MYFAYIHSYINYANLVWGNTHKTYLRKINSQQKRTLRLIHNKNRFYNSEELLESCQILHVYRLNLLNTAVFIHKINNKLPRRHSLKNLNSLLIRIQQAFRVGITGNHKLNYANVNLEFPLEVQKYETT